MRFVVPVLVLALGGLALGPAADARVAAGAGAAAKRPPSQAALAKRLARGVLRARTPAAGYRALVPVVRALGVGVYAAGGRPVVRGGERSARDFYLYDVELRALAGALARGETSSPADVAGVLARTGLAPGLSEASVRAALHAGVQTALRRPRERASLLPLLVRELGLRRSPRVDLARGVSEGVRLDALQRFLLEASVVGTGARRAASRPGTRVLQAASGCPPVKPDEGQAQLGDRALSWWAWKEVKRRAEAFSGRVEKALKVKKLLDNAYYGLHGSLLAYGLKVTRLGNDLRTHYGAPGHRPGAGDPLRFAVEVEMQDDLGAETIRCLALAGVKVPAKGKVEGVPVRFLRGQGDLGRHGTLAPAPGALGAVTATGGDGVAALGFVPRNEVVAGLGKDTSERGTVDALVEWANAFGNKLGRFNQYLTPKVEVIGWEVGFHEQWVFDAIVEGSQRSDFFSQTTYDPVLPCFSNSTAQGYEAVRFATSASRRIVFDEDFAGTLVVRAADTRVSPAPVQLPAEVERQASLEQAGGGECGDGGGPAPPPPAPDCGVKGHALVAAIGWAPESLDLRDETTEGTAPFSRCPSSSRLSLRLLGGSAGLSRAEIRDEAQGRFVLPLTARRAVDEGPTATATGSGRFATTVTRTFRETTALDATLTLTRVTAP